MRIVVDALLYHPKSAGIGRYIESLLSAYIAKYQAADRLEILALPGQTIAGAQMLYPSRSLQTSRSRLLYEQGVLPSWLSRRTYDVVHFPDYQLPIVRRVRHSVITVHDLVAFKYPQMFPKSQSLVKRELMSRSVKMADGIIVPSKATARDLQDILRVPPEKIAVIPHGVRPASCGRASQRRERPYFLAVGTIEPRKNFEGVIQAFAQFVHETRLAGEVELVVVGKKGWLYQPVLDAPARWHVKNAVSLLEYVPEDLLRSLYQHSLALVYPSFYEGFGLPVLEAMAYGTPVIASDRGALAEVCANAALIVDPTDIDQLAQSMMKIWQDPQLRKSLSQRGRQRAQQYTWDRTVDLTREVYSQVSTF